MSSSKILSLPFAYTVSYVEPRKRNPTRRNLRAETPVEVRSVDADEAPVAFKVTLPSGYDEEAGAGTHSVSARSHDGHLFAALGKSLSVATFQEDVLKPWSAWRSRFFASNEHVAPTWSGDDYPRLPLLARETFSHRNPMGLLNYEELAEHVAGDRSKLRFRSSDKAERETEAQTILSRGILVVDGEVWSDGDAREPHWTVRCDKEGARVEWSFSDEPLWYLTTFRIDRKDEAVAYAGRLAEEAGMPGAVRVTKGVLDACVPDLLTHDEVISLARQASSGMWPRSTNRAQVEPWSEAADAADLRISTFPREGLTRDDAVELLEAISGLRAELAGLPQERRGSSALNILERTHPAMRRWDDILSRSPELVEAVAELEADADALRLI